MTQQTSKSCGIAAQAERWLRQIQPAARPRSVVPLTGDASDRRYYRILVEGGGSIVMALHTGPIDFETLPFANVAELFRKVPLPVPAILGHADTEGVLFLEDLGDVTLQEYLGTASPSERAALYREAVAFIERLQRRGAELASDRYLPYHQAFDVEKLTWELDFFVRHFVEASRGESLSDAERNDLAQGWSQLATSLAMEPRVLCHRDYHSRNLMVHGGTLHIIDFQDARLGPDTYDLVSLLRDAYVKFEESEVEELILHFLDLKRHRDRTGFRQRFDRMALQRSLKALGTFGYQATARANPAYLRYVPRTLELARTNLKRLPGFDRLHRILATHLVELR